MSGINGIPTLYEPSGVQFAPPQRTTSQESLKSTTPTTQGSLSASSTFGDVQADFTESTDPKENSNVSYNMNHNLKSSLTELLNSKAVREDHKMRAWAQTRLMEAERELRRQRRRRPALTIHVDAANERSCPE